MTLPWPSGPREISLASDELHVWSADLDVGAGRLEFLQELLSVDEQERALRFRFWRDQRRFVVGRGILRLLIGRYLLSEPKSIKFLYTEFGKPYLSAGNLKFNLAHCQDLALYAFCLTVDVGVDLECIRAIEDAPGIASRFFSPGENKIFQAAPVKQQNELFLSYWTLKEAYVKAIGEGLSYPLDAFEVSFSKNGEPQLHALEENNEVVTDWSLYSLTPEPDCAAAVAIPGKNWRLIIHKFSG